MSDTAEALLKESVDHIAKSSRTLEVYASREAAFAKAAEATLRRLSQSGLLHESRIDSLVKKLASAPETVFSLLVERLATMPAALGKSASDGAAPAPGSNRLSRRDEIFLQCGAAHYSR